MVVSEKVQKRRSKDTAKLLEEMGKFTQGTPVMHTLLAQDKVSAGEQMGQGMKAAIPFLKGRNRTDGLIFHEFQVEDGKLVVLLPFSRNVLMPVEYMFRFPGKIPRSVYLKRALGSGDWTSASGDEYKDDEFCVFLKDVKKGKGLFATRLSLNADWTLRFGKMTIKLEWAFQLLPLPII